MSSHPFKKFIRKKSNAAVKEKIRQEKKQAKKQRARDIEDHFEKKRQSRFRENPKSTKDKKSPGSKQDAIKADSPKMPLNKFLAHCGVASRREAAVLISEGKIKVNGEIVTEPGCKVNEKDAITYNGKKLFITKNQVYILLNKPKDHITTTRDPQNRKTVLHLIRNATNERVYPVGRLDRNTSGVLLLTNDGELTQQLTHPSYNIQKIYEVHLDRPLTKADFEKIMGGIILEDGPIQPDTLAYADARDKSIIGIELHSGRNRIVRRTFEHLGYEVRALDRVMYAGLTKKNVDRGKWRFLKENEIRQLKYMGRKPRKKKPSS